MPIVTASEKSFGETIMRNPIKIQAVIDPPGCSSSELPPLVFPGWRKTASALVKNDIFTHRLDTHREGCIYPEEVVSKLKRKLALICGLH